ncbi:transcriptional antiterminator lict [Lacticaseibacillus camelliae DSM 22697 = JCM 13995]|uniref:Transcriptional antiterminator lict n=1 Tax=Lacticaseibacillus camelliae DSM 22697 = JCM 13995 TaxID=1423730 RepID=A0A0R2F0N1_9LACO|nr:transcriptional antiterminator lict [Lacticaseibacillus camelliae DSM 22697 = JCM 13995]
MNILLISQVLNNNVILVEDGQDQQKIIWGRGIGFKAHAGNHYELQKTDRVFSAVPSDDEQWIGQFKELSEKIPREYFELTEKIIHLAQSQIDADFDEHLLIPLTDHIYFAVERVKMGLNLANPMLYDLKRFFSKEFAVGKQAQEMIQQLSGEPISDDEAGFITIHLVEHEIQNSKSSVDTFASFLEITTDVNNIIEAAFGRKFSDDSIAVNRLMTHLHYLILRSGSKHVTTTSPDDSALLEALKRGHPRAGNCLDQVVSYLAQKLDYKFTDSDRLYLLIHIVHITE